MLKWRLGVWITFGLVKINCLGFFWSWRLESSKAKRLYILKILLYRVRAVFVDQIEISLKVKLTKTKFFVNFYFRMFIWCLFIEHIYLLKPHFGSTTYSTHFLKAEQALTFFVRGITLNTLVISVIRDCVVL